MSESELLTFGSVIRYRLRKDQFPCNPLLVWTGKILATSFGAIYVRILNEGFTDSTELVLIGQVVDVLTEEEYVAEGCW